MNDKKYSEMDEEEKKEMWDQIATWLSLTEEERTEQNLPLRQREVYESYGIPESTYYYKLQDEKFMKKIVKIGLTRAKKSIPKIIKILERNAEEGKEKSIEMFMKFVGDIAEKIDHTTKGEKIQGLDLTVEQRKKLAEYELRAISNTSKPGEVDTVLSDNGQELSSELAPPSDSGTPRES